MPEQEERTEQATPRRRQKAREQGRAARSRDLTSMAAMAGVLAVLWFAGAASLHRLSALMSGLFSFRFGRDPLEAARLLSLETMRILAPFFVAAAALSLAAAAAQGGFLVKPLKLEFERINPVSGVKRLFSVAGLGEALRSLLKFAAGGVALYVVVKRLASVLPALPAMGTSEIIALSWRLIVRAVLTAFAVFLAVAAADYLYERWMFERSLRMTREELREEYREAEGDPLIKSRIKSIQKELARRRMMEEVPKAAVVVTNPTHIAVALAYERGGTAAPRVAAKGRGHIAEKIREIARRHGVPVVEDKPLARALHKVALGAFIPEELYRAVAKILAYIYTLKGRTA